MKYIIVSILKFYRKYLSMCKLQCCRFHPSCSEYAIEAVTKYGAFQGTAKSVWRILRCNPFSKGGYDPVG